MFPTAPDSYIGNQLDLQPRAPVPPPVEPRAQVIYIGTIPGRHTWVYDRFVAQDDRPLVTLTGCNVRISRDAEQYAIDIEQQLIDKENDGWPSYHMTPAERGVMSATLQRSATAHQTKDTHRARRCSAQLDALAAADAHDLAVRALAWAIIFGVLAATFYYFGVPPWNSP